MELRETISSMRNKYPKDNDFYAAVSAMKRRADKGLLEGISSNDIDRAINEINNPNSNFQELDSLIYETEAAINTYDKILDENISDEELSNDLLTYYLTEGKLTQKIKNKQEEDNEDKYQYNDYKKKLRNRTIGMTAASAGVDYAVIRGISDTSRGKNIINTKNNAEREQYKKDHGATYISDADKDKLTIRQGEDIQRHNDKIGAEFDAKNKQPAKGIRAWWTGFKDRIGTNWNKDIKAKNDWWNGLSANQKLFTAAGMGAAGVGLAYGAYKLWRKHHDRKLREDVEVSPYYFDDSTMAALSEYLLELPNDDIVALIESNKEGISDITNNIISYLVETSLEDNENNECLYQYYTESLADVGLKALTAGSKIASAVGGTVTKTVGAVKNVGGFVAKHKVLSGITGGTVAVGAPLAIKQARKERLYESYYFDNNHMNNLVELLNPLSDDQIQKLLESSDPIISRITNNIISYAYDTETSNITESSHKIPGDITLEELLGGANA